jgi:hypothetical protein
MIPNKEITIHSTLGDQKFARFSHIGDLFMPLNQSLWRLTDSAERLPIGRLASEKQLEDFIVEKPEMLDPDWMLIGRQVQTDFKGIIDLLALQPDGTPVVIELKRDRTPRDVLGQTLDYASWLEQLEPSRLQSIYEAFSGGGNLATDFQQRFGSSLDEDAILNDHLMVIVASELDSSTERIVRFLSKRAININVLFFQVFQGNDELLLSRTWFVDTSATQLAASPSDKPGQWNGEFYASLSQDAGQSWADAKRFGFLTASGGVWYTRTLKMLDTGDRVWVSIPGTGYVGVGVAQGVARPVEEFSVEIDGVETHIEEAPTTANYSLASDNPDTRAWFVPIKWTHAVDESAAVKELGFFGNQNTVAKPRSEKWEHTVAVLKQRFNV